MPIDQFTELEIARKFDAERCRHYVNEQNYVLHCHHYSALFTQLAMDAQEIWNTTVLLRESARDSFKPVFEDYFKNGGSLEEKVSIAEQYYAFCGLGKMKIECLGEDSGEVVLETSHIDQGWLKKWGQNDVPVNFITSGFLLAFFESVYPGSINYEVREEESIVCGSKQSRFVIYKK